MVELFASSKANISEHIYDTQELEELLIVRKSRTVRDEGKKGRIRTTVKDYLTVQNKGKQQVSAS